MIENPVYKNLSYVPPSSRVVRVYGNNRRFEQLPLRSGLEELEIYSLSRNNTVYISSQMGLKFLLLRWGGFTDLSFIRTMDTLSSLCIWQTSRLKSLEGIEGLENLQYLTLFEAASATHTLSLEPLRALTQLRYLQLRGPMVVEILSPLASLSKLSELDLFTMVQDRSLAPLREIPHLAKLNMWMLEKRFSLAELAMAAAVAPNLLDEWLDFKALGMDCKTCGTPKLSLIGRHTRDFCPVC